MKITLFGGHGYLGSHLAAELRHFGHDVHQLGRDPAVWTGLDEPDRFLHLACPRNKPGVWSWRKAMEAHATAVALQQDTGTPPDQCLFISSLSVFDSPGNEYGHFKAMAEREVLARGWRVARLPTLLGTCDGVNLYRRDLGLHEIANMLANDCRATVNPDAVRHVDWIGRVVRELAAWCSAPVDFPKVWSLSEGVVAFEQIVGPRVAVVNGERQTYVTTCGEPMVMSDVHLLRKRFNELVAAIKDRSAKSC
ncbi:MAG: hypothetical protein WC683_07050 [bacterium]